MKRIPSSAAAAAMLLLGALGAGAVDPSPVDLKASAEEVKPARRALMDKMYAWRPVLFPQDGFSYARWGKDYDAQLTALIADEQSKDPADAARFAGDVARASWAFDRAREEALRFNWKREKDAKTFAGTMADYLNVKFAQADVAVVAAASARRADAAATAAAAAEDVEVPVETALAAAQPGPEAARVEATLAPIVSRPLDVPALFDGGATLRDAPAAIVVPAAKAAPATAAVAADAPGINRLTAGSFTPMPLEQLFANLPHVEFSMPVFPTRPSRITPVPSHVPGANVSFTLTDRVRELFTNPVTYAQIKDRIVSTYKACKPATIDKVVHAALALQIPPQVALATMLKESSGDPRAHNAESDATGLFQLVPKYHGRDVKNEDVNIHKGLGYLKEQAEHFEKGEHALAAYNAGPTAVTTRPKIVNGRFVRDRAGNVVRVKAEPHVPKNGETPAYVAFIDRVSGWILDGGR